MKPKLKFLSVEYEMLVAAWFLRSLDFASRSYPILSMAHKHFWGRETIKHVVAHQLAHFALSHKLLGKSTLRADFSMKAPEGTSPETLMLLVDRLFEIELGDMDYVLEALGRPPRNACSLPWTRTPW